MSESFKIHKYRKRPLSEVQSVLVEIGPDQVHEHLDDILGEWKYAVRINGSSDSTPGDFDYLAQNMAKRLENPEFSLSSFKYSSGSGAGIWTDSSDTWYEQHGILEDNEISLLSALTLKHYMINKTKDSD